jgi:sugar lactone lactonase YvrE
MPKPLLALLCFLSFGQALAQGSIRRFAGDSLAAPGFAGDNGPAINAKLDFPSSVTTDSLGNIYFVDAGNNRIRKITKSTKVITTLTQYANLGFLAIGQGGQVYFTSGNTIQKLDLQTNTVTLLAGTGAFGFSGDSGAAGSATLNTPQCLAIDHAHNYLYASDFGNHRIRKIDLSTGIITTAAGTGLAGFSGDNGPAFNAQLNSPTGLAVDSSGNLYLCDSNDRIRKINYSTGIITTFAGSTGGYGGDNGPALSALLNDPWSLAFDTDYKNLYIADFGNSMVRKIEMATDTMRKIAGNGNWNYSGDGGPAIYAELGLPTGVCVSNTNDIIIADTYNNVLREIEGPPEWPYHQFPDSNAVWNFYYTNLNGACTSGNMVHDYYSIVMSGDTLINSKIYHKLDVYYIDQVDSTCTHNFAGYQGAVREDTAARKVYFVPPSAGAESLLYDFTLQVGDTVKGYLAFTMPGGPDVVHSRDSVLVGTSYHTRWHINYTYGIYIIEGVGSTYGLIHPSLGEIADGGLISLTCFQQDGTGLYPFMNVSCQQITSVNRLWERVAPVSLSPNPASTVVKIICEDQIFSIELLDPLGNQVTPEWKEANSLDVAQLANGVYFMRIKTSEGTITERFVIQK